MEVFITAKSHFNKIALSQETFYDVRARSACLVVDDIFIMSSQMFECDF